MWSRHSFSGYYSVTCGHSHQISTPAARLSVFTPFGGQADSQSARSYPGCKSPDPGDNVVYMRPHPQHKIAPVLDLLAKIGRSGVCKNPPMLLRQALQCPVGGLVLWTDLAARERRPDPRQGQQPISSVVPLFDSWHEDRDHVHHGPDKIRVRHWIEDSGGGRTEECHGPAARCLDQNCNIRI